MGETGSSGADLSAALAEFAELNRRRLFGAPPLAVAELERWLELRAHLEQHFGAESGGRCAEAEQRATLRLRTHLRVELHDGSAPSAAVSSDISQGGLFIATRRPLDVGSPLRIVIDAGAKLGSIEVPGVVAWIRDPQQQEETPGMGVQFDALSDDQRAAIAQLVSQVARSS